MDAYEDLEGGEEVDYDYALDDDFFEDEPEQEKAQDKDEAAPPDTTPAEGPTEPVATVGSTEAAPQQVAEQHEPELSTATEEQTAARGPPATSGRQRIPIPVPRPSQSAEARQNGRPHAQQPGGGPGERRGPALPKGNPPEPGRGGRGMPLTGTSQADRLMMPLGARLLDRSKAGMHTANGLGMPLQFSHGMGNPRHGGGPHLPMPPGLPMPGMAGLSMPTRAGQSWAGSERRSRNQEEPSSGDLMSRTPQGLADRLAVHQYGTNSTWRGASGRSLAAGMEAAPASREAKRVWDRLGPSPQLAGDFDAGEEFEPPKKRPALADRLGTAAGALPRQQEGNPRRFPGIPPPMPPPRDAAAEAAEKAKKEAQALRVAEIKKQIEAQKLENSLINKMHELQKKEQIASLQDKIAKLEAAELRRQAAKAAANPGLQQAAAASTGRPDAVQALPHTSVAPGSNLRGQQLSPGTEERKSKSGHLAAAEVGLPDRKRSSIVKEALAKADRREKAGGRGSRSPGSTEEAAPSGDLREFLSQQRTRRKGERSKGDTEKEEPSRNRRNRAPSRW